VLDPVAQKLQPNPKQTRKPFTLIQMDNARVHTTTVTQEKLDVSRFKRIRQSPSNQEIALFDFFFLVGLNPA
jgi:hypothetical protein